MRALVVLLLASCGTTAPVLPAQHPANPQAPAGRLAPAPAATRAGAATYAEVPPLRAPAPPVDHSHHQHGGEAK